MNENKMGKFIAAERKKKNMTQKNLADKLYVTDRAVSKWERGLSYPDILLLEKISKILGVSVSELLNGEKMESINKEKADDIVKDGISIYKKHEKKKLYHKFIVGSISLIITLIVLIVGYSYFSLKHSGKIYVAPHTYIESDTKESIAAKAKANDFLSALKNKDIEVIDKLLEKYLTTIKEPILGYNVKNNINKYNKYLEEFYQKFTITNYKQESTYDTSELELLLVNFDLCLKHNETGTLVNCYLQIASDGENIYLAAIGFPLKYKESKQFVDNNTEDWQNVKNVFNQKNHIKNLNIKGRDWY